MTIRITRSSGNVFVDMGRSPEEAACLSLRSELMLSLRHAVDAFENDAAAATALKVRRPVITDLRRGRLSRFDLDLLVLLLCRAGIAVRMTTSRAASRRRAA